MENVKSEILSFLVKKITCPNSKGTILALKGPKAVGKTRIVRRGIAEILNLPFNSINFGGLTDSSFLIGHDMTYVGSSYGRIVQSLI